MEVEIEKIKRGKYEQRMYLEDETMDELCRSIARIGIINPLILERTEAGFFVVAGHRRLAAAKRMGLKTVPAVVEDKTKSQANEIAFAENYHRKNLSPIEQAAAIKDVLEKGDLEAQDIAKIFGRSEHWVRAQVAITTWPGDVQITIHNGGLSVSAASNLALVTDDQYRSFLLRNAVEQGATARTTAAWLQAWRAMQPPEEAILSEPVAEGHTATPTAPQAPCLACGEIFPVDRMSHVPLCGDCIKLIRQATVSPRHG